GTGSSRRPRSSRTCTRSSRWLSSGTSRSSTTSTTTCATSPTTTTRTGVRSAASSGTASPARRPNHAAATTGPPSRARRASTIRAGGSAPGRNRVTEHVLTIDLGTSGPKVALFTMAGDYVEGDFTPVELELLPDGGAEQSPDAWWRGIVDAAQRTMGPGTLRPDDVAAVAVTSQWSGTVPIDREGEPLHDAIIWMDSRGADDVKRAAGGLLRVQGYDPRKLRTWIKLTGGAPALSGKDPIAHILWFRRTHPDVARATWKYLEPKDWLNLKLTGRAAATFDSIVQIGRASCRERE